MLDLNASTAALNDVDEPTEADLAATEPVEDVTDWEALLEPVVKVSAEDAEAFWSDEAPEDERYSGSGIPSWSVWA